VNSICFNIRSLLIALLLCLGGCHKAPLLVIAQNTTLRPRVSVTLLAPQPLGVLGSVNQLAIEVFGTDSVNRGLTAPFGIRRSDGVFVQVRAALLHQDGTADTLSRTGYMGNRILTIGTGLRDTLHPPFVAVHIIASDSITLNRIGWWSRNID
jgi:hypothetical protein